MKKILYLVTIFALICIHPYLASHARVDDDRVPFTIVWLADTQEMAYGKYDHALQKMGKWIMESQKKMNIRYIVQTGDAVDNGASDWQWEVFDEMYLQFRGKIPYISAAGNHDVKKNGYLEYLQRAQVKDIPKENRFREGESAYSTLETSGEKFIFVAIGYGVEEASVDWANEVLEKHRDYTAILQFHDYLQAGGRFGITGKAMFHALVEPNPNVRLVLCGHVKGVSSRIDELDDNKDGKPDRSVVQLMYDYQNAKDKCGQLRTLVFNPKDHSITVTTYSPVTKRYYRDYMFGDEVTFTLKNAF
jgi:Predicted phosphohydrolases